MQNPNDYSNARVVRSEINLDDTLNSRSVTIDPKQIDKLKESIKAQGLIQPCLLIRTAQLGDKYTRHTGQPYTLIAGFRRQKAMDLLGTDGGLAPSQQEADYRIAPISWTMADALMGNLTENLARENLTTYELAMQCVRMRDNYGLTGKDIAARVKAQDSDNENRRVLSDSHLTNLMRCVDNLHPQILQAWKEQHPKASLRTLIALSAEKDQDAQLKSWKGVTEGTPEEGGEEASGQGGGTEAGDKPKRPSAAQIAIKIEQIRKAGKDGSKSTDWVKGAIASLRWAAGVAASIPGIKDKSDEETNEGEGNS